VVVVVLRHKYTDVRWIRILLEKLIVTQLVKKFPALSGTRRLITVFTRARKSEALYNIL